MPTSRNWPLIMGSTVRWVVGDHTIVAMPVRIKNIMAAAWSQCQILS